MPWHARLSIDYAARDGRSVARFRHDGPLRILQSLYPEGDTICHNVLVHPPGGLVGGDTLDIHVTAAAGSHGLVTTPGASRFYRSEGEPAVQQTHLQVQAGALLEWLPLEALCYSGCQAHNRLRMDVEPGGELIGWDVTALGLPHAGQPFVAGSLQQHLEVPGVWLERGRIEAGDAPLLDGALGLAGRRCLASLFHVSGTPIPRERREALLEIARTRIDSHALGETAGATSPQPSVIVVRVLAPVVEPAMQLLRGIWTDWRRELWRLDGAPPRIWST